MRQLVTSPKMLPGRLSPCWSTQSTCPVAEPSARSVTSIPNAVLPAASPGGCISAVPPPWMVATTVAPLATAVKTPGFLGAVMSEQAVVTTQATMAVAMRSLRRIIGASVQLRFVTGDAFALDRADTALHDRPSPSAEHQIKLTGLA